ncbi:AlkA N-terminal domain-containing protein [Phycicoccus sp. Soil748]|uniref:DNA-3-methyladenine glycosylase 2 n=1 Tax=Phycicoccus sp. Soil748 TaxID=1736397 RepID=UPI0007034E9A|nr:AlkA N-terminal domain-containing protein [Phycicoccus sp. Soil748]KRE54015.1 hypothetical protein ASG70_13255 [Phycicoccus sp. Soil748]
MTRTTVAAVTSYPAAEAFAALLAHAVPGLERVDASTRTYSRLVSTGAGPLLVEAVFGADDVTVDVVGVDGDGAPEALVEAGASVRGWLDLETDLSAVALHLGDDPVLAPLVSAQPGLRILGSFDGFESAVMTVLGQHVSLVAARTFGGRLVERWGRLDAVTGLVEFPCPATLAAVDPAELQAVVGVTGQRARTVVAVARACADGLRVAPGVDPVPVRRELLALPGIGPWTVEYVAMRAMRDPDAFPAGDLVLRKALELATPREVAARAAAWSPWRAYAAIHLWHHAAYSLHL